MNEPVSDSVNAQALIEELTRDEQAAHAAMKLAHERKLEVLKQIEEQAKINAELRRQEVLAQAAELKERTALGVSYSKLRSNMSGGGLRVVYVRRDVRKLLVAALPAENEQQFLQLCSTLIERLAGSHAYIKKDIEALKGSEATAHYFGESQDDVSVVVVLTGRFAGGNSALLSDYLTTYALEFGRITEYEEQE